MKVQSNSVKTPIYDVRVNGEVIQPTDTTPVDQNTQKVTFQHTVDNISTVEVELKNKGPTDTVVVNGNIVEDLLLVIEGLLIDKIDLLNNLSKISVYKDTHGNIHRTFNYITFNGVMTIKIHNNPIYTKWLANLV